MTSLHTHPYFPRAVEPILSTHTTFTEHLLCTATWAEYKEGLGSQGFIESKLGNLKVARELREAPWGKALTLKGVVRGKRTR